MMKPFTYLHTGHLHVPLSQLSCKYDSRSKHCREQHHIRWNNLLFTIKCGVSCEQMSSSSSSSAHRPERVCSRAPAPVAGCDGR